MIAENEIILYQPDEAVKIEVRVEDETVWLTQQQMAMLFETTKQNISLHINNVFKEKELERDSVVKDSLTTASDGKKLRPISDSTSKGTTSSIVRFQCRNFRTRTTVSC